MSSFNCVGVYVYSIGMMNLYEFARNAEPPRRPSEYYTDAPTETQQATFEQFER